MITASINEKEKGLNPVCSVCGSSRLARVFGDFATGEASDTGQEIMAFFQELNREGRTIIMVTHDLRLTARAKRTLRLANGGVSVEPQNREGDIHA